MAHIKLSPSLLLSACFSFPQALPPGHSRPLFSTLEYTVHCTLYTVHCTLYTVQCTLYTVHCTLLLSVNSFPISGPFPCVIPGDKDKDSQQTTKEGDFPTFPLWKNSAGPDSTHKLQMECGGWTLSHIRDQSSPNLPFMEEFGPARQ